MAEAGEVFDIDVKLEGLKLEIIRAFEDLHRSLVERRDNLLSRLARIKQGHDRNVTLEEAINELKLTRDNMVGTMRSNLVGEALDKMKATLDREIESKLAEKVAVENVEFVEFRCFSDKIRKSIGETDLIELIPEYVGRENPVLKRCRQGRGNGQFYNPRGISIDRNTNEVFIADKNNSRIQVLTAEGEYLRSFGTDHLKEPHGICVSQDGVFVTDRATECLLKFSLAGQFINKTGSRGTEPGCFSGISGLCYEAGLVYVCDVSVQRIQVINSNLQFVKEFGSGEITFPTDISIHSDTLHILSQDQNTIYCYNRDGNYLKKIELTGQEQHMTTALYFTTDKRGNFLIADKDWFLMIRNFN